VRAPVARELLPLAGASGLVFCVGRAAVKVFTDTEPADIRSCTGGGEAAAPGAGGGAPFSQAEVLQAVEVAAGLIVRQQGHPDVRRAAVLCSSWGTERHVCAGGSGPGGGGCAAAGGEAGGPQVALPYTVMPRLEGWQPIRALLPGLGGPRKQQVARQLGELVGKLHSSCVLSHAPQQAGSQPAAQRPVGSAVQEQLSAPGSAFWHDRSGRLWTSGGGSGGGSGSSDGKESSGSLAPAPAPAPWRPFLEFLRCRRRPEEGPEQLRAEESLPPWLLEQLERYLPEDPAALLGLSLGVGVAARSGGVGRGEAQQQRQPPAPCLLHGDLTGGNVLLQMGTAQQQQQQQQHQEHQEQRPGGASIRLLDLADAGHGDPLWDLVALAAACLGSDAQLLAELWRSYRQHCCLAAVWPARGGLALSYVALCYTLLHEEGLLGRAYQARPELWGVHDLPGLQRALWGELDEVR
jgi:hypothetical protein